MHWAVGKVDTKILTRHIFHCQHERRKEQPSFYKDHLQHLSGYKREQRIYDNGHAVHIPESDAKKLRTGEQNLLTCLSKKGFTLVCPTVFGVLLTKVRFSGETIIFCGLSTLFFSFKSFVFFSLVLGFEVSIFPSQLCTVAGTSSSSLLEKHSCLHVPTAYRGLLFSFLLEWNHAIRVILVI